MFSLRFLSGAANVRVRITLSNSQSGELNGSLLVAGSVGEYVDRRARQVLLASASHSAGISTTVPGRR